MKQRGYVPDTTDLDWIESLARPVGPIFEAIEAAALAAQPHVPILDRESGRVLRVLAQGRRRLVEVGTAYGYSTLWLALGQPADGTIVTIDPDRSRTERARAWWRQAGLADDRITVVNAPALEAFAADEPALEGPFDLAFIDALKPEYAAYLAALRPRLSPGALVVADNVLWGGRAARAGDRPADPSTGAIVAFDRAVLADPAFSATILPVGDGLLLAAFQPSGGGA
ncbi:MAG TPA: O-methyltransferase [Candidatus Limnocylindrales bacterium]|nr:O-methyltransferase [Candidatus Limnocylindrales bacterium]